MDLEKRLEQYLQSEDFEMDLGDLIHDYRAQGLPVPPMEQLREEATAEAWRSCRRCGAVEHLQW